MFGSEIFTDRRLLNIIYIALRSSYKYYDNLIISKNDNFAILGFIAIILVGPLLKKYLDNKIVDHNELFDIFYKQTLMITECAVNQMENQRKYEHPDYRISDIIIIKTFSKLIGIVGSYYQFGKLVDHAYQYTHLNKDPPTHLWNLVDTIKLPFDIKLGNFYYNKIKNYYLMPPIVDYTSNKMAINIVGHNTKEWSSISIKNNGDYRVSYSIIQSLLCDDNLIAKLIITFNQESYDASGIYFDGKQNIAKLPLDETFYIKITNGTVTLYKKTYYNSIIFDYIVFSRENNYDEVLIEFKNMMIDIEKIGVKEQVKFT